MCEITKFKIKNVEENCGWDAYFRYLKEATDFVRKNEKFSNDDVLFIEQVLPYYKLIQTDDSFDTKAINMGNEPVVKNACRLAKDLHEDFNNSCSKVFHENMNHAYDKCFNSLTDISFRRV